MAWTTSCLMEHLQLLVDHLRCLLCCINDSLAPLLPVSMSGLKYNQKKDIAIMKLPPFQLPKIVRRYTSAIHFMGSVHKYVLIFKNDDSTNGNFTKYCQTAFKGKAHQLATCGLK